MSPIPLIELDELEQRCLKRDFEILKVKIDLNSKKLFEAYQNIKAAYTLEKKDADPFYKGISLQYSDDAQPLFDGLNQVVYMRPDGRNEYYQGGMRLFHKKNEIAERFSWLYSAFSFNLFRGRLLESHPGHRLAEHSDGPIRLTMHVPITSHSDNLFYLNKKAYHLENDGCAYVINTSLPHWIENKSQEVRTHLIFNIGRMSFWPLNLSYLDKLDRHYGQIGHKGFETLMRRFKSRMTDQHFCQSCAKVTELFPIVLDFESLENATDQEAFQLLCQPCTEAIME